MNNEEILQELRDKVIRIEVMLEQQSIGYDSNYRHLEKRIEKVESNQMWLWRLCVGGLISGAIGLLFVFVK